MLSLFPSWPLAMSFPRRPLPGLMLADRGVLNRVGRAPLVLGLAALPALALANSAPTIGGAPPASVQVGDAYRFTPLAADADGDVLSYKVKNLPGWLSFDPADGTLSGAPGLDDVGYYRYLKVGVDDGSQTAWMEAKVRVKNNLPVITGSLPATLDAGHAFVATPPQAHDPDGQPISFSIRNKPVWATFDTATGVLGGTPVQTDVGVYRYIKIGASDGLDTSWIGNFKIVVKNQAPSIGGNPPTLVDVGQTYHWAPDASDPNGDPLRFSAINLPSWASIDALSGVITGAPGATDVGIYKGVRVVADDGLAITRSDAFALTVDSANSAPLIAGAPPPNAEVGAAYHFMPLVSDPDADDVLVFAIRNAPAWADFDTRTGALTGTPQAGDAGRLSADVAISVSDGVLEAELPPFSIQVAAADVDPLEQALIDGDARWLTSDESILRAAIAEIDGTDPSAASLLALLQHLLVGDYAYDFSNCEKTNCSDLPAYASEFLNGAQWVRSRLNALDKDAVALFDQDGYRLEKLLVLLGDYYRRDIRYPMDRVDIDSLTFLRAYYADHAVYNNRVFGEAQTDLGNFSRTDFSHVAPTTVRVDLTSATRFRATGVYALPGQAFTVTRLDSSDVAVKVRINTQRTGSTHEFDRDGYKRPKFLSSVPIRLESGVPVTLNSPYGGPVQLEFGGSGDAVSVRFEQVGQHPFWRSPADNEAFAAALDAGDYDWVELSTPGFEIHSTLEKFRRTLAVWGDAENLAATTMRYSYDLPHALAGFHGDGITPLAEVDAIAESNGWAFKTLSAVKHMNADQATCGTACSGNPFDSYRAFDPLGHGPLHELGHGLQGGRRFTGWGTHTMTNYYSYYAKSIYGRETGGYPDCQKRDFHGLYDIVQQAGQSADPSATARQLLMPDGKIYWGDGASIYIQMMMAAQANGALANGWHLRTLVHLIEYNFKLARKNATDWLERRASLGFALYSQTEASQINDDDFQLIALSHATGLDYRPLFDLYGLVYSPKASDQVDMLGLTPTPAVVYASGERAYCDTLDHPALPVDGVTEWPLP